jgi:similar to stage IV sporulation protein
MTTNISIKAFKKIRPIAFKTKCKVNIKNKKGLPFILHRYKKRKAFFAGIAVFLFLMWFLTSFIWVIEVEGNEKVTDEEIIEYLELNDLKPGKFKSGINMHHLENELMLKINMLSWVTIEIKGTKAIVRVKEGRLPPDIVEENVPCNIVASRDGIIKSIVAKSGDAVVKEGDTIESGQLLISGIIDSKTDGIRYIHSMGSVIARTWYEESREESLIKTKRVKTGNEKNRFSLKFMGKEIKLYLNSRIPYVKYDRITDEKNLKIGNDYILPFSLKRQTYREINIVEEKQDEKEIIREAQKELYNNVIEKLVSETSEIVNKEIKTIYVDEETLRIDLIVECIEDISVQEKIIID